MLIQTETTPNPSTLKFLPGQKVMEAGTRDFATPEEAEASPLAVGSSRVDLQACKLEYSIVSPK